MFTSSLASVVQGLTLSRLAIPNLWDAGASVRKVTMARGPRSAPPRTRLWVYCWLRVSCQVSPVPGRWPSRSIPSCPGQRGRDPATCRHGRKLAYDPHQGQDGPTFAVPGQHNFENGQDFRNAFMSKCIWNWKLFFHGKSVVCYYIHKLKSSSTSPTLSLSMHRTAVIIFA